MGRRRRARSCRRLRCAAARTRPSTIDEDDARGEFQDDTANDLAWARFDWSLGSRAQSHTIAAYSDTAIDLWRRCLIRKYLAAIQCAG